ncbi:calcium release-activated calcium channel protein 1 isoform X2 [Drosophila mauritiana]|uniref:Calcium release-activated calcium channel protein 1 isoform X2 n=1 Tax=Drosophila mauritiana TaxID=7226 RepID=A0A6P8JLI6_DROMA|nr:calcium release-activated calcium channel protein 1 isoform X2 [Drosophila mauritiana]XP_033156811.1 calcium release-activated calcium channel protein 1 isoform X2 [Drosophila mauritiana]XP_033156812.1 calcium release-activated calcium channel protein 1 isoform X2 [Drosophila mauritiana]
MSVWTTANNSGLETPTKAPITSSVPRAARSSAVITTGNHQQHHFQHVVAAAVAAATSVATGHQFQQQFPLHAHPHPHPQHHSNSPTGSGSNSNNSAGFQRTSISNSLLQFPPPPPPSSQNQAKPRGHHRTASSSMSQSGEDLHSPTYLSWRKLQLSRAKLKASSKTSALLSGFAMVAMVEVQLDHDTNVPPGMLIAFAICTTLLVAVHMLALMISTCILPNIETVCNLHSISLVHESPHERLHWYIETAWAFSTLLGLILFLLEIAILCWVKFYDLSPPAAWSACVVLIPVMIIFMAFAIHFYRSLVSHKYEVTVSGIRELEMLKEQMEQDHLEHHNNIRNNGMNYGASGDIV